MGELARPSQHVGVLLSLARKATNPFPLAPEPSSASSCRTPKGDGTQFQPLVVGDFVTRDLVSNSGSAAKVRWGKARVVVENLWLVWGTQSGVRVRRTENHLSFHRLEGWYSTFSDRRQPCEQAVRSALHEPGVSRSFSQLPLHLLTGSLPQHRCLHFLSKS